MIFPEHKTTKCRGCDDGTPMTRGQGWAYGKRSGFSPGAAARHRSRTRVPRILSFSGWLFLSGSLFLLLFFPFLRSNFI